MGSNSSKEFPAELSAQQIELIKSKTSMNSNEIFAWYSQFLDLTHGKGFCYLFVIFIIKFN